MVRARDTAAVDRATDRLDPMLTAGARANVA
jgi:hypothetical protein